MVSQIHSRDLDDKRRQGFNAASYLMLPPDWQWSVGLEDSSYKTCRPSTVLLKFRDLDLKSILLTGQRRLLDFRPCRTHLTKRLYKRCHLQRRRRQHHPSPLNQLMTLRAVRRSQSTGRSMTSPLRNSSTYQSWFGLSLDSRTTRRYQSSLSDLCSCRLFSVS